MHWSLAPVVACALGVCCANELGKNLAVLSSIKAKMVGTLTRQPNYTCLQEIERSTRQLPRNRYRLHDMLRLEVALVDGKELFAWPGAGRFEDGDLSDMVPGGGAIGSGNFATHARAVFQTSTAKFTYIGVVDLAGKRAHRFDYVIPQFLSGYSIRSGDRKAVVGHHGSFWADVDSLDVLRLEVMPDDIPPHLGIASARDVVDYARTKIGETEFLLPSASELSMVDIYGSENRNRTKFTSCRQYTGESVLTFAEAPEGDAATPAPEPATMPAKTPAPPLEIRIPVGLSADASLETEIDSRTSMVGDPIRAILRETIKHEGKVLFQKGATLIGRIFRLEQHQDHFDVDFFFSEVEVNSIRANFRARIDPVPSASLNRYAVREDLLERGLQLKTTRVHLRPGYRFSIRTLAAQTASR